MSVHSSIGISATAFTGSGDLSWTNKFTLTKGLIVSSDSTTTQASFVISPGTILTSPVSGALENDGTSLYYTDASLSRKVIGPRSASAVVATSGGDYTSLQSAIDALGSSGGLIRVRAGTYTLSSAITIAASNLEIIGEGVTSRFNFNGVSIPAAFKMADTTQRSQIHIENISIWNTGTAGNGTAIDASHFAISQFKDLWCSGVASGIDFNSSDAFYNQVENLRTPCSGASGFGIRFTSGANENTVLRTRILPDSTSTGIIVNAHGIGLYDVNIESGAAIGLDVQASGNDCYIAGVYLEANAINLRMASGVEGTFISGGSIADGTSFNIQNLGARGFIISGIELQYEPFTYHESSVAGMPSKRWVEPFMNAIFGTSQTFTAGRVLLVECELQEAAFVDALVYTVGTTSAGNVVLGMYGPIVTEETPASAPVLVQTVSTAQGTASTAQLITVTKTLAPAGRYYLCIEGDNATGTYMRSTGVQQVAGWGFFYDRGGGYGALTDPCPSVSANATILPGVRARLASLTTI